MNTANRNPAVVLLLAMTLLASACTTANAADPLVSITFDANGVERFNTPVAVTFDQDAMPAAETLQLFELTEDGRRPVPFQLARFEDGAQLAFVASGRTAAADSRRFVLAPRGDEAIAPEGPFSTAHEGERLTISLNSRELLGYQVTPMSRPEGGEQFAASAFIDPLRTPAGFSITDRQPGDHMHHMGLWWPWKYVAVDGNRFNGWELQFGEGMVRGREILTREAGQVFAQFVANNEVVDRTGDEPRTVLDERALIRVWQPVVNEAHGYFLDITLAHTPTIDRPIEIVTHRYSGLTLRGTAAWRNATSTVATSHGRERDNSDNTHGRWVHVRGMAGDNATAGVVMMSHPDNTNHPEKLRTWNSRQTDGAIFINFNPVRDQPFTIEPEQTHIRRYRLYIYDGQISNAHAEQLWKDYATAPTVTIEQP